MIALLLTVLAVAAPAVDPSLDSFLDDPWTSSETHGTPASFRVVTLAYLAEGCADRHRTGHLSAEAAVWCVERAVALATDPRVSPYGVDPHHVRRLGEHGLYLTHLAVVLAAYHSVVGAREDPLHERVVTHLAGGSAADPRWHHPTYPGVAARWPADQAATLYALHRYDEQHGTDVSAVPIAGWLDWMERSGTVPGGLHRSEVAGVMAYGDTPRGCALSWTVRYMAAFAPDEARLLWVRYRGSHWTGIGFREWPRGVDGPADVDSGPIVAGNGVAATAFGLGASRAVDDLVTYGRLAALESTVRAAVGLDPGLAAAADTSLARAIAWHGHGVPLR